MTFLYNCAEVHISMNAYLIAISLLFSFNKSTEIVFMKMKKKIEIVHKDIYIKRNMDSSTSRFATSENVFVEDILIYAAWQIKFQTENIY